MRANLRQRKPPDNAKEGGGQVKEKIGILTYHRSINYGALMQVYSLSKKIAEDFPHYDIEIIDCVSKRAELVYRESLLNYCRLIAGAKSFREKAVFCKQTAGYLKKRVAGRHGGGLRRVFEEHLKAMPLSKERIVTDDEGEIFKKISGKYKVLIVGSDAVWNWQIRKFPGPYFLNADLGAIKMSYAASSYGQDYLELTKEQKAYIEQAWEDFSYLGVRDRATEDFVKHISNKLAPHHNCDPTVFLDISAIPVSDEQIREIFLKAGVDLSKPVIGLMGADWLGKLVRNILGDKYQIVAVFKDNAYADYNLKNLSPFQWSKVFSGFSATFTHYFHGNLLSLKNGTPTIVIENRTQYNEKHNSKIRDLMARLELPGFCFYKDEVAERENEILNGVKDRILNRNIYEDKIAAGLSREADYYNNFSHVLSALLKGENAGGAPQ